MRKLVIISVMFILVLCASCLLAASPSKVKITGIYSDIYQSRETNDISGMELLIVKCGSDYYGVVQIAEGEMQIPFVVRLTISGNQIEFEDKPNLNEKRMPMKFKGVIYDKGIKGEWVGSGFSVDMKRGQSYWQKS